MLCHSPLCGELVHTIPVRVRDFTVDEQRLLFVLDAGARLYVRGFPNSNTCTRLGCLVDKVVGIPS